MELLVCKKVGWKLIDGPYSFGDFGKVGSKFGESEPVLYIQKSKKDKCRELKEMGVECMERISDTFSRCNLNTVLGSMTEEWDFWLSEKVLNIQLDDTGVNNGEFGEESYLKSLSQKRALFRSTDRGSYILFCELTQVIDSVICHP